jgi:hypothetical protein
MMSMNDLLPDASLAGQVRRWFLPINAEARDRRDHGVRDVRTTDVEYYQPYARFLGLGTSHTEAHQDHVGEFVTRGVRCNACRWFEARIFRELVLPDGVGSLDELDDADARQVTLGEYVIHSAGMSEVRGEVPFFRYETTRSPYMVIELMTTRRTTDRGPEAFLAKPAAHALAEAVEFDVALREAYVNRAVS